MTAKKKATHKKVEGSTVEDITNGADEPVVTVTDANGSKIISMIREAWNAVKGDDDASFETCAPAWVEILLAHAKSVLQTGAVMSGDTQLARFEQELAKLKQGEN